MKDILTRLFQHEELTRAEATNLMIGITRGEFNDSQIASLLTVFRMRNISVDELIGFRDGLLQTRVRVDELAAFKPIDIVGTGGDGKNTFNISTCSCFVVAGAGYHVAKHGNYGATSVSGASNVIEQHGVKFTNDPSHLLRSIEQCGMTYMHAPLFNPAMKNVAPVRKALGVRTVFNLLGPLVNPSLPTYQLLGVADLPQMRLYTNVFQTLGIGFAVVNSLDGYDEISLTTEFKVTTNGYERIFTPTELGFTPTEAADLYGGNTPQEAARIFDAVLQGTATRSQTECVIANSAFAIQAIDSTKSIDECIGMARESIESGKALQTLKKFIELNS
jgi:anthranilate phosphoribosyltransferase